MDVLLIEAVIYFIMEILSVEYEKVCLLIHEKHDYIEVLQAEHIAMLCGVPGKPTQAKCVCVVTCTATYFFASALHFRSDRGG